MATYEDVTVVCNPKDWFAGACLQVVATSVVCEKAA
jgi:hypothetical protein